MSRHDDTLPDGAPKETHDTDPMGTAATRPDVSTAEVDDLLSELAGRRAPVFRKRLPQSEGLSGAHYDAQTVPAKGHSTDAPLAPVILNVTAEHSARGNTQPLAAPVFSERERAARGAATTPAARTPLRRPQETISKLGRQNRAALLALCAPVIVLLVVVVWATLGRRVPSPTPARSSVEPVQSFSTPRPPAEPSSHKLPAVDPTSASGATVSIPTAVTTTPHPPSTQSSVRPVSPRATSTSSSLPPSRPSSASSNRLPPRPTHETPDTNL